MILWRISADTRRYQADDLSGRGAETTGGRWNEVALPAGWDGQPETQASVAIGSAWLRRGESALLIAPSVIVPEEFNVLINPAHPDSAQVTARKVRPWTYDPRLLRA